MSLLKVLLCGLLLYSVNVGLQVSIGAYYLGMRECYRGITMEYDNFNLANALGQNPALFSSVATYKARGWDHLYCNPNVIAHADAVNCLIDELVGPWMGKARDLDLATTCVFHGFQEPYKNRKKYVPKPAETSQ